MFSRSTYEKGIYMDVSVIFATHNRADVIADVLNAWRKVQKNTIYEYEIICSDDASDDETIEIIKQAVDLPITLIQNEKGGASKARNAALKIAKGKIIIFTGDDIFPPADFVNSHYENYLKYGSDIATLGRIEWHDELVLNQLMYHVTNVGCEQFGFIGLPPYQLIDFRHFYTSNISVSRELLDRVDSYFNTGFDKYGFEDIELGYRLQKCGMRIYYDPDIVVMHHHIYDDVDKFCNRQMSAGEELVVFQQMHDDLEDKCICDTVNCREALEKYLQFSPNKRSVAGYVIWTLLKISKKMTRFIEKISQDGKFNRCRKMASVIYAGIFKFYFYYGCVYRIALGRGIAKSKLAHFTYKYMKKGYAQIYFDTGAGYSEAESRKWVCWDDEEWQIEKKLPENLKEIRFSPLKNQCYAQIKEAYFITKDGDKKGVTVEWHNSRNGSWQNGDYTHTNDPQILIRNIADGADKLVIKMQVKNMKKRNLIEVVKKAAIKLCRRQAMVINSKKEWEIEYASGQPRKIQIIVDGAEHLNKTELILEYRSKTKVFGDAIVISDIKHIKRGYSNYLYRPCKEPLDMNQMFQVAYALLNSTYDYVIVSKAYEDYPLIAAKCIDDVAIYSELIVNNDGVIQYGNGLGRYMRLPSFCVESHTLNLNDHISNINLIDDFVLKGHTIMQPVFRMSRRKFEYEKKKPLIFVFPIFLAVGGVERNTIETMRALKENYNFCIITMEKHSKQQGSLHYQLKDICEYVFDLREISEFDHYLEILYELEKMFRPDAIWLCNNSPWFETNTMQIRSIFRNTPIIAQDVYDTKEGWIEYYNTPGVKSFDRYIAITELIRECFKKKYDIADEKIDVIYPVVDGTKVKKALSNKETYEQTCKEFGLNPNAEHYSFIARLSEQKNPIRYLELAKEADRKYGGRVQFIMVGNGPLSDDVDRYIADHQMEEVVKRIPYIADVPNFMRVLSGLIITSYYEGMPIVSIEAMSMSVPVLSTDAGDLKRFLEKTQGGIIIDEMQSDLENFDMFRNNLTIYAENAGKHAAEILDFFSSDIVAKKYIDTFEKAMLAYKNITGDGGGQQ